MEKINKYDIKAIEAFTAWKVNWNSLQWSEWDIKLQPNQQRLSRFAWCVYRYNKLTIVYRTTCSIHFQQTLHKSLTLQIELLSIFPDCNLIGFTWHFTIANSILQLWLPIDLFFLY